MTTGWDIQVYKRTCYGEARGEGAAGMRAQAWSVLNPFNAKRWYSGKTLAETCLMAIEPQYPQYDCWLSHNAARKSIGDWLACVNTPDNDPLMKQAEQIVCQVLTALATDDPTDGATHYYDVSIPAPPWTIGATLTLSQGKLRFYKNVN